MASAIPGSSSAEPGSQAADLAEYQQSSISLLKAQLKVTADGLNARILKILNIVELVV